MIDGGFEGKLSPDGASIVGTWTQRCRCRCRHAYRHCWMIPSHAPTYGGDANPEFEVATIKPSKPDTPGKMFRVNGRHLSTLNTTLDDLIIFAYGVHVKQIVNGPPWLGS